MKRHRGVNRAPILPDSLRKFFRTTSKQEWAELAFDFAIQLCGCDEAKLEDVEAFLLERRAVTRRAANA